MIIENKKAEQRKRLINSEENARYESVMSSKIEEIMQNLESDDDKKDEKITVRYEYQNGTYYLNGSPALNNPPKLLTAREKEEYIRSKLNNQSEFGYLFDLFVRDDMKALKNCDPYVIMLLMSKDIRLARDYIKQMAGNKYKRMSPQEFSVVYDIRGLEHDGGHITPKERRGIRKMAKQQRKAALVLEDKRKLPWYAAISVIGALAIGSIAGIIASNNTSHDKDEGVLPENSYSDTMEPSSTSKSVDTTIETTNTASTIMTTTEAKVETTTAPSVSFEIDEQDGVENDDNNNDNNVREDDSKEEKTIINIGDKIVVQDGLKYTADCLGGGKSNKIGAVSWRPATEYSVDKVAFVYQGKTLKIMNSGDLDVEKTLTNLANQNGISPEDITTSVLLSLVPGTADTGWASINIDEMRHNVIKPVEEKQSNVISHVDNDIDR